MTRRDVPIVVAWTFAAAFVGGLVVVGSYLLMLSPWRWRP